MKYQTTLLVLGAGLVAAVPTLLEARYDIPSGITQRAVLEPRLQHAKKNTYNDWDTLLKKPKPTCPPVAAIFARGTFDSGSVTFLYYSKLTRTKAMCIEMLESGSDHSSLKLSRKNTKTSHCKVSTNRGTRLRC